MPKITVAIATGRDNEDTHYEKWMEVRRRFLDRELQSKHLNGEFGALLAGVLDEKFDYHIEYQLRALALGTRQPDRILVVDRCRDDIGGAEYIDDYRNPGRGMIVEPMVSPRELEFLLGSSLCCCLSRRSNKVSMGCNDKNTAIALCETEYLLMLDDCCLPGFGLVEAAYKACEAGAILLVGHQQMHIEDDQVEVAQANWPVDDGPAFYDVEKAKQLRRVFGVWAMSLSHILAVNGFNTQLDGTRGGLDLELLERMDRYARAQSLQYVVEPNARIYEIGHEHPWKEQNKREGDWKDALPSGWGFKAPGPNLKAIRKACGIKVGSDVFDLAGHAEQVEQAEHLEEIIEDVLDDKPEDE
jgi:hypothetical protein